MNYNKRSVFILLAMLSVQIYTHADAVKIKQAQQKRAVWDIIPRLANVGRDEEENMEMEKNIQMLHVTSIIKYNLISKQMRNRMFRKWLGNGGKKDSSFCH